MQYSGLRSGSTFVDGQDRLRTAQPLTQKDRQDSQTNLSDLGPSASQVAASLEMFTLLEKVKQLELEVLAGDHPLTKKLALLLSTATNNLSHVASIITH